MKVTPLYPPYLKWESSMSRITFLVYKAELLELGIWIAIFIRIVTFGIATPHSQSQRKERGGIQNLERSDFRLWA